MNVKDIDLNIGEDFGNVMMQKISLEVYNPDHSKKNGTSIVKNGRKRRSKWTKLDYC